MRLNKKVLCFIDEYGTAGDPLFALGCVIVWARECGSADKTFSDLLPANANEVHASKWEAATLQGLLQRVQQTRMPDSLIMLNKLGGIHEGGRPEIYAKALIETVKIGIKRFQDAQGIGKIGNVDVITDANGQNTHREFRAVIERARMDDGRFRAVNGVSTIDSTASRILQLADIVAHSRSWLNKPEVDVKKLRETFGIEIL
ncbi:MAG: DUF3800 domain-containing protein [Glycocaulis sp.]